MSEILELLHPTNWMIFAGLLAFFFFLNRQWVHLVMMVLCFSGWAVARAGLNAGAGEGPIIPLHWLILVPVMAGLGAATVTLAITGVLMAVGALVSKRLKEEKAAKERAPKGSGEVDGSAG